MFVFISAYNLIKHPAKDVHCKEEFYYENKNNLKTKMKNV